MDKVATVDPDDLEKEALAAAAEARSLAGARRGARPLRSAASSALKLALRDVRDRETGMTLNAVRETVESALAAREDELARAELEERLATERVDVTLPAELLGPPKLRPRGTLHPSTLVRRDVEDIFLGLGYEIVDGREVETTRYNFDALGFPDWHPARSPRDSLFLDDETVAPHGDLAGADPQDGGAAAADLHGLDRPRLPARHDRRDALPDLPPVRGARHRQGDHAGRPQGDAAPRDAPALRAGA